MLSPQALIRGMVSRILPPPNIDGWQNDVAARMGRYGEIMTMPAVRKSHTLADEGTYFTVNNAQTGSALSTTAGFTATTPFLLIENAAVAGGVSIYLDYLAAVCTAAGSAASALSVIQATVVLDSTLRYSSGGTLLSPISTNMNLGTAKSNAIVYAVPNAIAASALARTVAGLRTLRPCVSTTVAAVVGDMHYLNSGGVEGGAQGNITVGNANLTSHPLPPIVIGPQQSALLYLYYAAGGTIVAGSYAPEIGWWER
jgi:hypothetical protein